MRQRAHTGLAALMVVVCVEAIAIRGQPPRIVILDHARVIDGTGGAAQNDMRVTVRGDRIESVQPSGQGEVPDGAERLDLAGLTLMPGLIDLHFHVENDPKLALRQLANGVTSFRDPGQWIEQYESLRALVTAERLAGPRMALTGPHIDGERPAYPADSVVARDPEEARRAAERNIADGAAAIKILLPAAIGQRPGRRRRVPRPWRSMHRAPRDPRRAGDPGGRPRRD